MEPLRIITIDPDEFGEGWAECLTCGMVGYYDEPKGCLYCPSPLDSLRFLRDEEIAELIEPEDDQTAPGQLSLFD